MVTLIDDTVGTVCHIATDLKPGVLDDLGLAAVEWQAQEFERRDADLVLEVRDDGIGIAASDSSNVGSIGLAGMRERAQLVGGGFSIAGAPGAGTTVRVQVPWRQQANA